MPDIRLFTTLRSKSALKHIVNASVAKTNDSNVLHTYWHLTFVRLDPRRCTSPHRQVTQNERNPGDKLQDADSPRVPPCIISPCGSGCRILCLYCVQIPNRYKQAPVKLRKAYLLRCTHFRPVYFHVHLHSYQRSDQKTKNEYKRK